MLPLLANITVPDWLLAGLIVPGLPLVIKLFSQKLDNMKADAIERERLREEAREKRHAETMEALQQNHVAITQVAEQFVEKREMDVSELLERILGDADRNSPRAVMYAELAAIVESGPNEYYRMHPERAGDQRARDAHVASMGGVRKFYDVLDRYEPQFGPTHPLYKGEAEAVPVADERQKEA